MGIGARLSAEAKDTNSVLTPKKSTVESSMEFKSIEPVFSLDDLILSEHTKSKILDIASYSENSDLVFKTWGLENTHRYSRKVGINLWGPPGTGKTMAAHAIANYLHRKILIVNYADIESKYVGETPKNICRAFEIAKKENSILFFDEADAILSKRVTNMTHATDVSVNQTRSVMLMLLNDFQDIIIFATNFIENFDPAFMRRILMHVKFELPDALCRYHLWAKYIPTNMPNDFDIKYIADTYDGLSGSDIANSVLSTAFASARMGAVVVRQSVLEDNIRNIIYSKKANKQEKTIVTKRAVSEDYVKKQLNLKEEDDV